MDDAYLRGEPPGGRTGLGSENKRPIVAAVTMNETDNRIHARATAVSGFSSEAITKWAKVQLAPGNNGHSDGLACFHAVTASNCHHEAVVTGRKHQNELSQIHWVNTLLGNIKASFSGIFQAFNLDKYARRYKGATASDSIDTSR